MTLRAAGAVPCLVVPELVRSRTANGNLAFKPRKNRASLVRFSAPLRSPDVRDDETTRLGEAGCSGPVPGAESLQVPGAYFAWRRSPEREAWAK
jgi:hypothetical protein